MKKKLQIFAQNRPLWFVLAVMLGLQVIVVGALLLSYGLDIPILALDLPILLLNALLAVFLLAGLGWWGAVGFNAPSAWKNLHFLIFPVLLLLVPTFLFPVEIPTAGRLATLIVVTLLIGFQEEAIFRGVILRALLPRGILFAVIVSALLFGVIHANSLFIGRDPSFVTAQIVASFLGAIGLAALRLRINSLWPLVLLHALNDLVQFSATGGLEAQEVAAFIPIVKIVISGLMALYGIYLLWGEATRQTLRQSLLGDAPATT